MEMAAPWDPAFRHFAEEWRLAEILLFGAAAAIFLILGLKVRRDLHLARFGCIADGTIAGVSQEEDSDFALVRFTDGGGRTHEFRSDLPQISGRVRVGASVPVRYDPADPRRARLAGKLLGRAGLYATYLIVGGAAALIGTMAMLGN